MPGSFFDSNTLVYMVSANPSKAAAASAKVRQGGTISVQVLNEVTNVARRKMKMDWLEVRDVLTVFRGLLRVKPLTLATHELGIDIAERYQLSIYDSMIVASALDADCDVLYSEDMQQGLRVRQQLTIVNPFAT